MGMKADEQKNGRRVRAVLDGNYIDIKEYS